MEFLSHSTPPSFTAQHTLTVAEICSSNTAIATEVPSISFVYKCRSTLTYATKLLAAYQLAQVPARKEYQSNGTKHCEIEIQNRKMLFVLQPMLGKYNHACLDSVIISEDKTMVLLNEASLCTFTQVRSHITVRPNVTTGEYPSRDDLLDEIPEAVDISLAKFAHGGCIITNKCNPAYAFCY